VGSLLEGGLEGVAFQLADHLELMNGTGSAVREDKRGAIAEHLPPILERVIGVS
jgi:hypothetical protein